MLLITLLVSSLVFAAAVNELHDPKYNHRDGNLLDRKYFVELKDGTSNAEDVFMNIIRNHHVENDIQIRSVINHKFLNAVSMEIRDARKETTILNIFMKDSNVESITPISLVDPVDYSSPEVEYRTPIKSVHNLTSEQIGLASPHRLSQVDRVHNDLNLTGEGLFIGIIDSGVDYTHPALGGGFGEGYKIIAGYDFVGNHWNSSDPNSKPEPKDTPLDNCGKQSKASGHGTHVSGIIAGYDASKNFTGVAPGAKLGMWRVFSCQGSAFSDIVIEAILKAYDAGVDIISMSLGSDIPWSTEKDLETKLIAKITASGVSVVISAGNSGRKGAFTSGAPSNSLAAFSVASVNNEYLYFDGSFTATRVSYPIGFNFANGTKLAMPDGDWAPSYDGIHGNLSSDACTLESVSKQVQGKIALVKRGDCDFIDKLDNINKAGGIAAIIYDSSSAPFQNSILVKGSKLPVVFISLKDGSMLAKLYKPEGEMKMKFSTHNELQFFKSPYSTAVSTFSSVGPSSDLLMKPNIAGVGELIYSTIPQYMGSWGIKQGTSMACPYVAGSIALYLQHHGVNKTSRKTVHEKFQNYAFLGNVDNSTSGHLNNPVRQGAGLIQVYDTIMQTVHASPAEISFNDTFTNDYKTQAITIYNDGPEYVSYRLFNNVSVSVEPIRKTENSGNYYNNHPAHTGFDYAEITFSENEVHLRSGESQTVQVTVHPPNTDPLYHIVYGGFIQFDPVKSSPENALAAKTIHVPYFGIVGSQRDLPIFDDNYDPTVENNGTNTKYDDVHDTILYEFDPAAILEENHASLLFRFHLFSPTLVVKGELFDASGNFLGYPFQPLSYVQRDFYKDKKPRKPLVWNGQYFKALPYDVLGYRDEHIPKIPLDQYISVDSGDYTIRISALTQFGDKNNEDDWESYTVGPIVVDRIDDEYS